MILFFDLLLLVVVLFVFACSLFFDFCCSVFLSLFLCFYALLFLIFELIFLLAVQGAKWIKKQGSGRSRGQLFPPPGTRPGLVNQYWGHIPNKRHRHLSSA